jgi:catechol 2,3-dioxygenase-like lactoylglutathione lyase family enzyme
MIAERRRLLDAVPAMPAPAKLAHVVFNTARFEDMTVFYTKLLRAKPAYANDMIHFMTYDEEHHRIGLINRPELADCDPARVGLDHIAFTYPTLELLLAAYVHNKQHGIVPFWTIIHGPTVSIYYRDPDGNRVEFQYDVFPDTADVDTYLTGGAYDENFIGIIFDPDDMVARYEAGAPIEELVRRPLLPDGATPWDMVRH